MGHEDGTLLMSLGDGEETPGVKQRTEGHRGRDGQFDLKQSAVQHKQEVSCVNVTGVNRNTAGQSYSSAAVLRLNIL